MESLKPNESKTVVIVMREGVLEVIPMLLKLMITDPTVTEELSGSSILS